MTATISGIRPRWQGSLHWKKKSFFRRDRKVVTLGLVGFRSQVSYLVVSTKKKNFFSKGATLPFRSVFSEGSSKLLRRVYLATLRNSVEEKSKVDTLENFRFRLKGSYLAISTKKKKKKNMEFTTAPTLRFSVHQSCRC